MAGMEGGDDYLVKHSRDLRVNSYTHRATEPGYKVSGGEGGSGGGGGLPVAVRPYCLAVKNIPTGLTRTGLSNIFSQFGDLLECQLGGDRGKVAFSSGVQAATAIAQLDRKEPYRMVVEWQVDKEIREKKQMIEEEERSFAEKTNVEFDQFLDTEVKWDPEALLNRTNTFKTDILKDKKRVKDDTTVQKVVECSENTSSCPEVYQFNLPLSVPSPPAVGLCCRCNLPGILLCSVCKAWYCSAACQKDDWFTHKQQCGGKPPPLEIITGDRKENNKANILEAPEESQNINKNTNVNSGNLAVSVKDKTEEVVVSYLRSPSDLYVQAVPSLSLLTCMMVELQSHTNHTIHPTTMQQDDNTFYLAFCEGIWYRAKVISLSPTLTKARVLLVDYGNTDTVEVDSIRTLSMHKAVQPLARGVKLVSPSEEQNWTREDLTILREIVGEGDGIKFQMEERDGFVTLVDDSGRNVVELWKKRIAKPERVLEQGKEELLADDVYIDQVKDTNQVNSDEATGNPFLDQISRSIVGDDSPALSDGISRVSDSQGRADRGDREEKAMDVNNLNSSIKVPIISATVSKHSGKAVSKNSQSNNFKKDDGINLNSHKSVQSKHQKFIKGVNSIHHNPNKTFKSTNRNPRKSVKGTNQNFSQDVQSRNSNKDVKCIKQNPSLNVKSINQNSIKNGRSIDHNSTNLLPSVLDDLPAGCRVELLKVTAEPWSSFRSICVRVMAENKEADWVLGGLQVEGSSAKVLDGEFGVGEVAVAWNKDDQMFYRVIVIRKDQDQVCGLVKYHTVSLDFGREIVYNTEDLRQCWEGVRTYSALGIVVESCDSNLSKDIIGELDRIGRDGVSMEVINCVGRDAILAMRIKGKEVRWKARPVVQEKEKCSTNLLVPPPPLPRAAAPIPLAPGLHNVFLLSAESPAMIYICTMSQYNILTTTMVPTIQEEANTSHPVLVPVQDSLVLANYSDMWHRARLDLTSSNCMLARLTDLGHTITVTKDKLKLAEPSVRSWPAVAVPCVLAEWAGMARDREMLDTMKQTWSDNMKTLSSEFQELELRVLSVDEGGLHVVHIPAWEGLIKRGRGSQL